MTTSLQFIFVGAAVGPVAFIGATVGSGVGGSEGVGVGAFVDRFVGDKVGGNVGAGANVVGVTVVGGAVGVAVVTVRLHALSAYATLFTVMRLQPCHQP